MGKVLNKAIPDHMKKFGIKTNHTGRTGWQTVIRRLQGENRDLFKKREII